MLLKGVSVMKKALALLLVAVMAFMYIPALAEGEYSGQTVWSSRMAAVNGEVYCLSEPAPLWVNSAVYCLSPEGKTAVARRWAGWERLYAAGDRLLLVHSVLNLGEVLGSHPASVQEAQLFDPATGRSLVLGRFSTTEKGTNRIFAAAGQVYRTVRDGDCWELQRLADLNDRRSWMTALAWTGNQPDVQMTFCVIGSRGRTVLYEYASGKEYDVTALMRQGLIRNWTGVVERGVLYQAQDGLLSDWLTALDLTTGEKSKLVRLVRDRLNGFLLAEERAILLYSEQGENYRADVYDRSTWTLTGSVDFTEYPEDVLLLGDRLFVSCSYAEAGAQIIDLTTGELISTDLQ